MKGLFSAVFVFIILSCGEPLNVIPTGQGDKIIFISTSNGDDWQISKMNFDGTDPSIITDKLVGYGYKRVSPDGRKLAFNVYENEAYNLFLCNMNGTFLHRIASSKGYCGSPSWSPAGDRLIYLKNPSNSFDSNCLMLYDLILQKEVILMNRTSYSIALWINENEIALVANSGNYKTSVYNYNLRSGIKTQISPSDLSISDIEVSPDGKFIAATSSEYKGSQIYILNSDGGNFHQITSGASPYDFDSRYSVPGNDSPAWSPDGSRLAYVSYVDGDTEICIMDVDGLNKKQLTFNQEHDLGPSWSKDGKYIFFSSTRERLSGGRIGVIRMDAEGNNQINLTHSTTTSSVFIATY